MITKSDKPKNFWSTEELAKMAKVSSAYIRQLCIEQRIKAEKVGRFWIISTNEVTRFLRERPPE